LRQPVPLKNVAEHTFSARVPTCREPKRTRRGAIAKEMSAVQRLLSVTAKATHIPPKAAGKLETLPLTSSNLTGVVMSEEVGTGVDAWENVGEGFGECPKGMDVVSLEIGGKLVGKATPQFPVGGEIPVLIPWKGPEPIRAGLKIPRSLLLVSR